jgi:hypothetical protein
LLGVGGLLVSLIALESPREVPTAMVDGHRAISERRITSSAASF